MDTVVNNSVDTAAELLPDQVEMLYKTNFNQAWGRTIKHYQSGTERVIRQIDRAHQRAVAEVEKYYVKTRTGGWIRKR